MVARWFAVLALLVGSGLVALACSGDQYNAACGAAEGCGTIPQVTDATLPDCSEGPCKCADPELVACCPFGWRSCDASLVKCRTWQECEMKGPACESDGDCDGPPDARCGAGRCEKGECVGEIWAWKIIPNQYPGDCKVTRCSTEGDLEVITDPSDMPDDGNICTFDTCEGSEPTIIVLPDGLPCPGDISKVCWMGKCEACSSPLDYEKCPAGLYCRWKWCVSFQCSNGHWDGNETDTDCGGPECAKCGNGNCKQDSDCASGRCNTNTTFCYAPQPDDGVMNGEETGVDCGQPGGPPCNDGEGCLDAIYCKSGVCYQGICQKPSCVDSIKNGAETGPDCGGGCSPCPN